MLALLAAVVTPLLTAFGILYRDRNKTLADQLKDVIGQRDNALAQLRLATPVLDEANSAIREHVDRKRRA